MFVDPENIGIGVFEGLLSTAWSDGYLPMQNPSKIRPSSSSVTI